ncbi:MAG TPA: GNAT family N-acetyltransferase [Pyrinomonadaceae bacterium]|nr:GNAT family N-acetyltransferase [Pyrinomonadaceae bacterium]
MLSYRLLTAADFTSLYECFLVAFSDYLVDMQMSEQEFAQRLARDGVQLELSAAAFDDERMIGFYMNGYGQWQGKQTAYDAGTGVVPDNRSRGVAKDLFAFVVSRLKERSVSQYLLEVLSTNERAVALYRKLGFVEVRRLAVLRSQLALEPLDDLAEVELRRLEEPDWKLFQTFWDGYPSWQNSIAAVERVPNDRLIVGAHVDGKCVGYGIAFTPAANLMQLAVVPAYRRKGIGSRILRALSAGETLKVNNIDEELKGTLGFFEANGFKIMLEQFEMTNTITAE